MGVIEAIRTGRLAERLRLPEPESSSCLNCGESLAGPFCAQCGQRNVPAYPSVRELVQHALEEVAGWDGRFASTLRALLRHPGILTREFLEGRRVRYISPLRLYLSASVVYFLLAAAAPEPKLGNKTVFIGLKATPGTAGATTSAGAKASSRPERVAAQASESLNGQELTAAERDSLLKEVERAPSVMRPALRRIATDPAGFKRSTFQAMPRMLFALLPVFALIVSLFYRRRKYPEHLYFALHLHAFVFLVLSLVQVAKYTHQFPLYLAAVLAASVALPIYATKSFRRVYGGGLPVTLLKEAGITVLYCAATAAAFVTMLYWVSLQG
jgi:hypothetical protein